MKSLSAGLPFLLVIVVSLIPRQPASEVLAVSLEECLQMARHRNPLIHAARQSLEVFEAKYLEASWAWFPKASFKTAIAPVPAQEGNAIEGYTDYSRWGFVTRTEIEGAMPVYTFGKISALKAMARQGIRVGKEQVRLAQLEVDYQVRRAFYGLQAARELSKLLDEGEDYLKKAKKKLNKQRIEDDPDFDQNDWQKLIIVEAEVKRRRLEAKRLQLVSREGLRIAAGISAERKLKLKKTKLKPIKFEPKPLEHYVELAQTNRPELKLLRSAARASEANQTLRRRMFFPDLFLAAFFHHSYSNVVDSQPSPFANDFYHAFSGGAFLGLRYELDIPLKLAKFYQARAEHRKVEHQMKLALRMMKLEVTQVYQEVKDYQQLVHVNRKAFTAAKGWLTSAWQAYDSGFGELKELLDPLKERFKRQAEYLESIYRYNDAVARLLKVTGARSNSKQKEKSKRSSESRPTPSGD